MGNQASNLPIDLPEDFEQMILQELKKSKDASNTDKSTTRNVANGISADEELCKMVANMLGVDDDKLREGSSSCMRQLRKKIARSTSDPSSTPMRTITSSTRLSRSATELNLRKSKKNSSSRGSSLMLEQLGSSRDRLHQRQRKSSTANMKNASFLDASMSSARMSSSRGSLVMDQLSRSRERQRLRGSSTTNCRKNASFTRTPSSRRMSSSSRGSLTLDHLQGFRDRQQQPHDYGSSTATNTNNNMKNASFTTKSSSVRMSSRGALMLEQLQTSSTTNMKNASFTMTSSSRNLRISSKDLDPQMVIRLLEEYSTSNTKIADAYFRSVKRTDAYHGDSTASTTTTTTNNNAILTPPLPRVKSAQAMAA